MSYPDQVKLSQLRLLWFQVVLQSHKYTSWKVFLQTDTKLYVFTWTCVELMGLALPEPKMQVKTSLCQKTRRRSHTNQK